MKKKSKLSIKSKKEINNNNNLYLSQYLFLNINKNNNKNINNNKKLLTPNSFIDYWIYKYLPSHINEFSNTIKSYENNPNPLKKYNELLNFYLNDLKNKGYSTLNFDIIFESFFPKPTENISDKKIDMSLYMTEMISSDFSQNTMQKKMDLLSINSYFSSKNQIKFKLIKNINNDNYKINIEEVKDDIYITFLNFDIDNNNYYEVMKYNWGKKELFNDLLNKIKISKDTILNKNFSSNPIRTVNYNFTNSYLIEKLNDIKKIFENINLFQYVIKDMMINEENNKDLYNLLKIISSYNIEKLISPKSEYINNSEVFQEFKELFKLDILFLLHNYIKNYINQFIDFDNNIYIKIKKINEIYNFYSYDYEENKELYFDKFDKKINITYFLGKKNYKSIFKSYTILNDVLKLFLIIYEIQMIYSISEEDNILSLLLHQYDYSIIKNNNNKYFIRSDIENYYLNKFYILNQIFTNKSFDSSYKIKYYIPFLLNNSLFLNIKYELNLPYDLIFNNKSLIIHENLYSNYTSNNNFLENVSLNKNYILYNNKNKNFEELYSKLDLNKREVLEENFSKNDFNIKDINFNLLKGGSKNSVLQTSMQQTSKGSKAIIERSGDKIKFINYKSYYNIYEEKELNPIKDFKPSKYAYCSLYYGNNQYFLDTMLFGYSLYLSGTKNDRILICTNDVIYEQRKQLSRFYNRIFVVKPLDIDPLYFKSDNRWYGVFNKLYAFYLEEYQKIFMIDTDMIIQKSEKKNKYDSYNELDLLFDELNTPCGMCYDKEYINKTNEKIPEKLIDRELINNKTIVSAGIFLIKPSKDIFYDILYKTNPELNKNIKSRIRGSIFPEEAFLANYFKKDIYCLSVKYSFTPFWLDPKNDKLGVRNILEKIDEKDVVVVHFIGYKNWTYLMQPFWFEFEYIDESSKIEKYKKLWCLLFFDLQKLCEKNTHGIESFKISSLINYCKWNKIKFLN